MTRSRLALLLGGAAAVVALIATVGQGASDPPGNDEEARVGVSLGCGPADVETSTVVTYAAGARGQQDPRDSLGEFVDRTYPGASSADFREAANADPPVLVVDGAVGPIAIAYMEPDGDGGWRLEKFSACHQEFEQANAKEETRR